MRIISKFKDYYDIGLSYGVDPNITYVRKTDVITTDSAESYEEAVREYSKCWYTPTYTTTNIMHIIVGFCGEIYPYWLVTESSNINFVRTVDVLKQYIDLQKAPSYYYVREDCESFLELKKSQSLKSLFTELNVPIFLFYTKRTQNKRYGYWSNTAIAKTNPYLRPMLFQKIKSPYDAFQELSQYVGGVLHAQENTIVDVSDNDMLVKKGFNKWSFKKLPTKRR